ncbi:hypothetical protein BN1058_01687 [Paraliobacillus sp. PM-2]|uniref:hypothetical protein n=1 Tax=Paraliobacillus sp. PM-2 TaxID=1462524 RepID=UPI00061CA9B2|nr:hypothetical protein [Paraliobacillus sp. PM-2]CQR47376.1 hypothetical protein BN1058_01687 [Paraliobacillus sp. PM-2]
MVSVNYFQLSKDSQGQELVTSFIEVIQKSTKEFATTLEKNIKVIGLEEEQSTPRLILLDLVANKPYLREFNIFKIRINTSNYEVLTNEERYIVNNSECIEDILSEIISNYDIQEILNDKEDSNVVKPVDDESSSKKEGISSYVSPRIVRVRSRIAGNLSYSDLPKDAIPSRWVARKTQYVAPYKESISARGLRGTSAKRKYNKRTFLKKVNKILTENKLGFRATNVYIQKDDVIARDKYGNTVKFSLDKSNGKISFKGSVEKPLDTNRKL